VQFPGSFKGTIVLVGYIYTYCPDICSIVTLNMREVQRQLDISDDSEVHFVGITMDPGRDTPQVLADYADRFDLDDRQWSFLTGDREVITRLMDQLEVVVRRTPTRFTDEGTAIYFIDHSDKVSLMDEEGNIRQNYMGSELAGDQVVEDIMTLLQRKPVFD